MFEHPPSVGGDLRFSVSSKRFETLWLSLAQGAQSIVRSREASRLVEWPLAPPFPDGARAGFRVPTVVPELTIVEDEDSTPIAARFGLGARQRPTSRRSIDPRAPWARCATRVQYVYPNHNRRPIDLLLWKQSACGAGCRPGAMQKWRVPLVPRTAVPVNNRETT